MVALSRLVGLDDHGPGMVVFRRFEFLVEEPGSFWEESCEDVVFWVALLVSTTMSGGVCDKFSAVRDSRIVRRDARCPILLWLSSSVSILRDRVLIVSR